MAATNSSELNLTCLDSYAKSGQTLPVLPLNMLLQTVYSAVFLLLLFFVWLADRPLVLNARDKSASYGFGPTKSILLPLCYFGLATGAPTVLFYLMLYPSYREQACNMANGPAIMQPILLLLALAFVLGTPMRRRYRGSLAKLAELKGDELVAIFPCSTGAYAAALGAEMKAADGEGGRVVAIDTWQLRRLHHEGARAEAEENLRREAVETAVSIETGSIVDIPLESDSVDVFYAPSLLELPHHGRFLDSPDSKSRNAARFGAEVMRVLKPGGRLFITAEDDSVKTKLSDMGFARVDKAAEICLSWYPVTVLLAHKPEDEEEAAAVRQESEARREKEAKKKGIDLSLMDEEAAKEEDGHAVSQRDVLSRHAVHSELKPHLLAMYVLLTGAAIGVLFVAVTLFDAMNLPTTVPYHSRFAPTLLGLATGYPLPVFINCYALQQAGREHDMTVAKLWRRFFSISFGLLIVQTAISFALYLPSLAVTLLLQDVVSETVLNMLSLFGTSLVVWCLYKAVLYGINRLRVRRLRAKREAMAREAAREGDRVEVEMRPAASEA